MIENKVRNILNNQHEKDGKSAYKVKNNLRVASQEKIDKNIEICHYARDDVRNINNLEHL